MAICAWTAAKSNTMTKALLSTGYLLAPMKSGIRLDSLSGIATVCLKDLLKDGRTGARSVSEKVSPKADRSVWGSVVRMVVLEERPWERWSE
jgi:hypothetical protein